MAVYTAPVQDLVDELGKMPGIGPKSAQRIAFHLLKLPRDDALRLATAITEAKARVSWCERCFNVASAPQCDICSDDRRDATLICVVEEPRDVVAVEKTHEFKGRYHVLQGAISPIEGVGPEQLRVKELLARLLKPMGLRVTRLASGLPVGGDLEYADELTLGRAFEGRRLLDV